MSYRLRTCLISTFPNNDNHSSVHNQVVRLEVTLDVFLQSFNPSTSVNHSTSCNEIDGTLLTNMIDDT